VRRLDRALITAAGRPAAERDFAGEAKLRSNSQAASAAVAKLDAEIRRDFPQYADLTSPQPLAVAAVQPLLRSDEALLAFAFGPESSWLWVVKHDQFRMLRLDISTKQLAIAIATLRSRLDPQRNPGLRPFPASSAYALYNQLLQPAAALLADARHVLVVPDGLLQSLPIGVLVSEPPAHDPQTMADHREIAWFARDHAVTSLPSVGSLKALRSFTSAATERKPFIGIGNPVLGPAGGAVRGADIAGLFRGSVADVDKVRELPSLPETAEEIHRIASILGAKDGDLYLGSRASEPLLRKANLDRYRIVEFATHGLLSGEIEGLGEAALVLTPPSEASPANDGLLTASKIASLKLSADWVVLSACNTALGNSSAVGLSGLAQAFFYAGARSLLVSNWPVASEATVKLTTNAFKALAAEPAIGQAEAMRRAMMAMLSADNPPEFSHPLFWAPFTVLGEGRANR
jgi:CHAT domain-containing protein